MYTANGAYLSRGKLTKGVLAPGIFADMIVLDSDPVDERFESSLLTLNVDYTIVGGRTLTPAPGSTLGHDWPAGGAASIALKSFQYSPD